MAVTIHESLKAGVDSRIRAGLEHDLKAGSDINVKEAVWREFRTLIDTISAQYRWRSGDCPNSSSYALRLAGCSGIFQVPQIDRKRCCMTVNLEGHPWTITWFGDFAPDTMVCVHPHGILSEFPYLLPMPECIAEMDWWLSYLEKTIPEVGMDIKRDLLLQRMREVTKEAKMSER